MNAKEYRRLVRQGQRISDYDLERLKVYVAGQNRKRGISNAYQRAAPKKKYPSGEAYRKYKQFRYNGYTHREALRLAKKQGKNGTSFKPKWVWRK